MVVVPFCNACMIYSLNSRIDFPLIHLLFHGVGSNSPLFLSFIFLSLPSNDVQETNLTV